MRQMKARVHEPHAPLCFCSLVRDQYYAHFKFFEKTKGKGAPLHDRPVSHPQASEDDYTYIKYVYYLLFVCYELGTSRLEYAV